MAAVGGSLRGKTASGGVFVARSQFVAEAVHGASTEPAARALRSPTRWRSYFLMAKDFTILPAQLPLPVMTMIAVPTFLLFL